MNFRKRKDAAIEVGKYPLSLMEQDALSHYPGKVTPDLIREFRGAMMVFQAIFHKLWTLGLRIRIVPEGTKLTDLPECRDLKKKDAGDEDYDKALGLYRPLQKIVVIKEEHLSVQGTTNQRYFVPIHEIAHAVYFLFLTEAEKNYIRHLWRQEKVQKSQSPEYRLKNEWEFFADGFLYYVTPNRVGKILKPMLNGPNFEKRRGKICCDVNNFADKEDLRELNIKLYEFMEGKFKGIIDSELVMACPTGNGEEERYELWPDKGIYGPVIYIGCIG